MIRVKVLANIVCSVDSVQEFLMLCCYAIVQSTLCCATITFQRGGDVRWVCDKRR